jgi:RND family efflux transporter MFP subunit
MLRGPAVIQGSRHSVNKRTRRGITIGALLLIGIVATAASATWSRQRSAARAAVAQPDKAGVPVAVVKARRATLDDTLTLAAEFKPFQEVNVYARVTGYVKEMRVDVGDRVKAGDVLALLEIPELQDDLQHAVAALERAHQEVVRAKAAYDDAHLTYQRLSEVIKQQPNLIAQQEIDQARAKDEAGKAAWDAAQSAVREASASRAKYSTLLGYARIMAPFGGVITRRFADTGSLVGAGTSSSGQALVRLSQLDPLRLVLPVPESAVPKIHEGAAVDVLVQATQAQIAGRLARTSGEVATDTRTMHVEVDVPNKSLALAPGMYASAVLVKESHADVLSLPIDALPDRKDGVARVYVLNKDHRLEERTLTLGLETPDQVEVTSGLAENELVVAGRRGYQAGQLVEPRLLGERGAP